MKFVRRALRIVGVGLASVITIVLCFPANLVQAGPVAHHLPELSSVFPQGAGQGETVEASVLGEFLDRAETVFFPTPGICGRVIESRPTALKLEFQVGREAEFGPHFFRVVTPRGASNLLLFRVGDLSHQTEREPNDSFGEAEEVHPPLTINGRIDTQTEVDFFRFQVEKGQTWIFDLRASRNGNGLDCALVLLDARRRELEYSEDVFNWDPFFSHTFDEAGAYFLVVQSSHGRFLDSGKVVDPGFGYQLDIRQSPHLQTLSPLAFRPGVPTRAILFGHGLLNNNAQLWFDAPGFSGDIVKMEGARSEAFIRVPPQANPGPHRMAVVTPEGRSNTIQFIVDPTPAHSGGDLIQPPTSIVGVARYASPERYFFIAKAGQSLVFEVRAWRYGSPADLHLRLLERSSGKEIAVNDDAKLPGVPYNKDPLILHTFETDGSYELQVRNSCDVDGENYPYQLVVRPFQPAVELILETDQPYVEAEAVGKLKISAVRKEGFEGAIPLVVLGLPEGVRVEGNEIAKGMEGTELIFHTGHLKPGTAFQIRVTSPASPGPARKFVTLPKYSGPETALNQLDEATLVVSERPLYSLESSVSSATLARGSSLELPVMVERAKDFAQEIRFALENLPRGVTAEADAAAGGSREARIVLKADADARPGRVDRVAVLGVTSDGRLEAAAAISLSVE